MTNELSVGLSDGLVALLSIGFASYFRPKLSNHYHLCWFLYFLFSAIGCLLGGIYHIFVPGQIISPYADWLWAATLLCVGMVALLGLQIICYFMNPRLNLRLSGVCLGFIFLVYAYFILQYPQFKYASMFMGVMVLGQLLLGIVLGLKSREWFWGLYLLGWVVYVLGAIIQFSKISLNTAGLSYKTLYHLVSAIAWLMIFLAAKHLEPKA